MNYERRLRALECITQQQSPDTELAEINQALIVMSKAEMMAWLESLIAVASSENWLVFLVDWLDFLRLKGSKTWPYFDRETKLFIPTPESRRWGEIHQKHWQWGGWTGLGLPPEFWERS
jgi:hypothetical protein